jgi:hypothetical protein
LRKKFNIPLTEANKVAFEIGNCTDSINNFEEKGKLLDVGDNLSYIPEHPKGKAIEKNGTSKKET